MPAQLAVLGLPNGDYILCLNETESHFTGMVDAIAPQGKICSIDGKNVCQVRYVFLGAIPLPNPQAKNNQEKISIMFSMVIPLLN
jgi:hypothetical protein